MDDSRLTGQRVSLDLHQVFGWRTSKEREGASGWENNRIRHVLSATKIHSSHLQNNPCPPQSPIPPLLPSKVPHLHLTCIGTTSWRGWCTHRAFSHLCQWPKVYDSATVFVMLQEYLQWRIAISAIFSAHSDRAVRLQSYNHLFGSQSY